MRFSYISVYTEYINIYTIMGFSSRGSGFQMRAFILLYGQTPRPRVTSLLTNPTGATWPTGTGPTTTVGLRSVSRGRRCTGDAFGSCGHGAVRTDGTGWAVDFRLRPRPLSRGRRRTVVPYWLRRSRRGAAGG